MYIYIYVYIYTDSIHGLHRDLQVGSEFRDSLTHWGSQHHDGVEEPGGGTQARRHVGHGLGEAPNSR